MKHELVLGEMRALANDSEFAEYEASKCTSKLNRYWELTNRFTELLRLVSLDEFIRDAKDISVAILDFLSTLHTYQVRKDQRTINKTQTISDIH